MLNLSEGWILDNVHYVPQPKKSSGKTASSKSYFHYKSLATRYFLAIKKA